MDIMKRLIGASPNNGATGKSAPATTPDSKKTPARGAAPKSETPKSESREPSVAAPKGTQSGPLFSGLQLKSEGTPEPPAQTPADGSAFNFMRRESSTPAVDTNPSPARESSAFPFVQSPPAQTDSRRNSSTPAAAGSAFTFMTSPPVNASPERPATVTTTESSVVSPAGVAAKKRTIKKKRLLENRPGYAREDDDALKLPSAASHEPAASENGGEGDDDGDNVTEVGAGTSTSGPPSPRSEAAFHMGGNEIAEHAHDTQHSAATPSISTLSEATKATEHRAPEEDVGDDAPAEARIAALRRQMERDIEAVNTHVRLCAAERRELTERRKAEAGTMLSMHKRLQEALSEQTAASEREDYELADRLSGTIDEMQQGITRAQHAVRELTKVMAEVEGRRSTLVKEQAVIRQSAVEKMRTIEAEQRAVLDIFLTQRQEKLQEELNAVEAQELHVERATNHIETDTRELDKAEAAVEESVLGASGHLREEKTTLAAQASAVAGEIAILRLKLAEREAEQARVLGELATVDAGINQVRGKFKKELDRIKLQRDAVNTERAALDSHIANLERAKAKLAAGEDAVKAEASGLQSLISTLDRDIGRELRRIKGLSLQADLALRRKTQRYEAASDDARVARFVGLQANDAALQAQLAQLDGVIAKGEKDQALLAEEIAALGGQLPDLESKKKSAAAERNFKEAGRLANEVKRITTEKTDKEAALDKLRESMAASTESRRGLKEELAVSTATLAKEEKDADEARLRFLARISRPLRAMIERAAAKECFTEADQLQPELDAYLLEMDFLRAKHEWPAEHPNDVEDAPELDDPLEDDAEDGAAPRPAVVAELRLTRKRTNTSASPTLSAQQAPAAVEAVEAEAEAPVDTPSEPVPAAEVKEPVTTVSDVTPVDVDALQAALSTLEQRLEAQVALEEYEACDALQSEIDALRPRVQAALAAVQASAIASTSTSAGASADPTVVTTDTAAPALAEAVATGDAGTSSAGDATPGDASTGSLLPDTTEPKVLKAEETPAEPATTPATPTAAETTSESAPSTPVAEAPSSDVGAVASKKVVKKKKAAVRPGYANDRGKDDE